MNFESIFIDLCKKYNIEDFGDFRFKFENYRIFNNFIEELKSIIYRCRKELSEYNKHIITIMMNHIHLISTPKLAIDVLKIYQKLGLYDSDLTEKIIKRVEQFEFLSVNDTIVLLSMCIKIDMNNPPFVMKLIGAIECKVHEMNDRQISTILNALSEIGIKNDDLINQIIHKFVNSMTNSKNCNLLQFIEIYNKCEHHDHTLVIEFINEAINRYNQELRLTKNLLSNEKENTFLKRIIRNIIKLAIRESIFDEKVETLFNCLYSLDGMREINYKLQVKYKNKKMVATMSTLDRT